MHQRTGNNLLLYCLNIGADKIESGIFEHLSKSDWNEMVQQADNHRVTPLLYQRLKARESGTVIPANILQKLQESYLRSALRNTYLYKELSTTIELLQNDGIPVVVLKGAALGELIYQDIALRPMDDIDLLVRDRDILRIYRVLSRAGLELREISWDHVKYRSGSIPFELKNRMNDLPKLNPWANVCHVKIASTDTLVLRPEAFLVHVCLHADCHFNQAGAARLLWWFDITELLKYYGGKFNWDYVIQIARKHKVDGAIHRVLYMAREDFGAPIPLDVLSQFKDNSTNISAYEMLSSSKVSIDEQTETRDQQLCLPLLYISNKRASHGIIYHFLRGVFPCKQSMVQRYSIGSPSRVYFYHLARISGGFVKVAKKLLKLR